MKLSSLRPKHFLISFLYILNPYGLQMTPFSYSFSQFCVVLHFLQLFSYVFKLEGLIYTDSKVIIFTNVVFYSNFANILAFFELEAISFLVYFAVFAIILLFYGFWTVVTLAQFYKRTTILRNKVIVLLHSGFSKILSLYSWILMTPVLEMFINMLSKTWPIYVPTFDLLGLKYAISLIAIMLLVLLGVVLLWLNRSSGFQDKDFLRFPPSLPLFFDFLFQMTLILGFDYITMGTLGNLVYFLLLAIGVFRFLDYIVFFPVIHEFFGQLYISMIAIFMVFLSYFTYLGLSNFNCNSDDLYVMAFMAALASKVTCKFHEQFYQSILCSNPNDGFHTINYIEELYRYYLTKNENARNAFFFFGVLGKHHRECKFHDCAMKAITIDFVRVLPENQDVVMKRLISEIFMNNIRSKKGLDKKRSYFVEDLMLKYISYSAHFNFSYLKSFFEIQNIISLHKDSKTFYFNCIALGLLRGVQLELNTEEQSQNDHYVNNKEIPLKIFFSMLREKQKFQKSLLVLLKKRLDFWEKYKEGFQSYESVIAQSYDLINEMIKYKQLITENLKHGGKDSSQNAIFALKFHSIYSCVIVNNINEGVQLEDKLEKILKRELTLEKNILNCHSFFQDKLVVIQCSFMHLDGRIMESSKTAKLASFFKYSVEELRNIRTIKSFMPKFVSNLHEDLVGGYINDAKSKNKKKKIIESYGVDKRGCMFPIKVYLNQNFQRFDDLIFDAAILNVGYEVEQICLIDNDGFLQGLSNSFVEFLEQIQNEDKMIEINDLVGSLNLFCLINGLEEVFKENIDINDGQKGKKRLKNTIIRNLSLVMRVPVSLSVIIEILKEKTKEERSEHYSSRSHQSMKSKGNNSGHNLSKSSKFLSLFFSTLGNLDGSSKSNIEEKFLKKQLTYKDVLRRIMDSQKCLSYKILFSLKFSVLKTKNQELVYAAMSIAKMSKFDESLYKTNISQDLEIQNSEIECKEEGGVNMPNENRVAFKETNSVGVSNNENEEDKSNRFEEKMKNMILKDNQKNNHNDKNKEEIQSSSLKFEEDVNNRLFTTEADQELIPNSGGKNFQGLEAPRNRSTTLKNETLHLSQDRIRILTKKESINESLDSEELKKSPAEDGPNKGKTSLAKIYDVVDRSSQASSLSSLKKTFSIFNMIKLIQGFVPPNIRNFGILQIVEFLVILIYCVVIYESCLMFVAQYYTPLQDSLDNFANLFVDYSKTNMLILDLHLMESGVLDKNTFGAYSTLYKNILDDDFNDVQTRVDDERKKPTNFQYQEMILNNYIYVMNYDVGIVQPLFFLEFLNQINQYSYVIKEDDLTQISYEMVQYFSTNYIQFIVFYTNLSNEIETEFSYYNGVIAQQVESLMIGFICLVFLLKVLQTIQLYSLSQKFTKLLNIFLRINANEAFNEGILTKQIADSLQDPFDNYLQVDYPERVLTRKTVLLQNEEDILINSQNSNRQKSMKTKKKKNVATSKKFSLHNLRSISKLPIIIYIFLTFSLMFAYLFANFYFAEVITRKQIDNLIGVAAFFENMFTAPVTAFTMTNILYYEKIIGFQLYVTNKTYYEQQSYAEAWSNLADSQAINQNIPTYAYFQSQTLSSDLVSRLINGDSCQALNDYGYLTAQEYSLCTTNYDGAFQKGFVNVISMMTDTMNREEGMMSMNSTINKTLQDQQIIEHFQSLGWNNSRSLTCYFFNMVAKVIFEELNTYYKGQINAQLTTLENVLLSTSILMMVAMIVLIYVGQKAISKIYRNITTLLSIIPFDKLINDEQTSFLIKKVLRE